MPMRRAHVQRFDAIASPAAQIGLESATRSVTMTRKRAHSSTGKVVVCQHTSKILADNPLGDPHVRQLAVWLPPQYDGHGGGRGERFPVLYDLVGFTGSGIAHVGWKPFGDNVAE